MAFCHSKLLGYFQWSEKAFQPRLRRNVANLRGKKREQFRPAQTPHENEGLKIEEKTQILQMTKVFRNG